jgi:hypothetical protein
MKRKTDKTPQENFSEWPPLDEAIAKLAYLFWEADGRPEGSDMRYWLRAEREVLETRGLPHPDDEGAA